MSASGKAQALQGELRSLRVKFWFCGGESQELHNQIH
jgi:hypothetical protein